MAGDKVKSRSWGEDEFISTISDTEEGLPDLDEDEDIAQESQSSGDEQVPKPTPKSKKSKAKSSRKQKKKESELDPSFTFDADNFFNTGISDGWDFDVAGLKNNAKSQVDLDRILRSKGGLKVQEESENSDSDSQDDAAENGDLSGVSVEGDSADSSSEMSDEEEHNSNNEQGKLKGPYRLPDSDVEDLSNGNSSEEEAISGEESEESLDEEVVRHPMDEMSDSEDDHKKRGREKEEEKEEDSAEAVAEFYSNDKIDNKSSVHKTFQTLSLSRPILRALGDLGYSSPTPIQGATIPMVLLGKDVVAGAMTGSGKTAAYMVPILERLLYRPKRVASTRVVVLTPTRELSIQVADVGRKLGKYVNGIRFGLAVGGLNLRIQEQELKSRPDFVIATPGRFIDHVRNSPSFQVEDVEILVIDEADRMLEEGFQKELTEILQLIPSKRQTLLFSATMNARIKSLIQLSLHKPVRIMIDAPKTAAEGLTQEFVRIRKRETSRPALLVWLLSKLDCNERTMVFVAHKQTAHRLRIIAGLLGLKVGELHGSLTQDQRLQSMNEFKKNIVPILICTDLASRGLDIPRVEVVINYEMPKSYDIYIHRVGRTARAGREGRSISFVGEASFERAIVREAIRNIEKNGSGSAVSRNVDWNTVENISKTINSKEDLIEEVLTEEKEQKLLAKADMEVKKGENQLKYHDEILARPRRTWFESEADKLKGKRASKPDQANNKSKKRKPEDQENNKRLYKKTKNDRLDNSKPKAKGKKGKAVKARK